ncbi:HK97 family phage prohead protease OS=Advenella kashmirensis (strain DSM 17095 / LMG 22695 / WT001) GN=TKWG_13310 PE=4 SV=1: Peptidase_U35 [Gemmata massiliana]|uniref:Prohead serine protease domain-containing protein n=1 Tax=Gemmata massiliana TaxID=1210884 RepID=A0A6P2D477_9BACT|nr:HK97 family phage prohead protease [Gemmata massiliana]VTR95235.1 HK97 family phage prohead protease OS=Advenella kashmirensis (strain DSM 17095 / LMG 22695 / WT001) GN=TKWG_13310 PE=4 SV=1: Peptidase_U35 [Gemmata massiliana]
MNPNPLRRRSSDPPANEVIHLRAAGDAPELRGDRRGVWDPAGFNRYSLPITEDGRTFREVIRPGAFARTLAAGADVRALVEHDKGRELSSRSAGLLLQEDGRGLFASFYAPATPAGDELLDQVRAGKFRGGSFGFRTVRDRTNAPVPNGPPLPLVELLDVELLEVPITASPAYPATVLSLRSDADRTRERRLRLAKLRG